MPSIGEQGWGNLVSNNFEILDTISNTFNTQIDTINENLTTLNLATASGTRILSIPIQNSTITASNFSNYASYDENNVYIAQFGGNIAFSSIPQPPHSCRLMIIVVNGDATISGNIDTYPTTLQSETPPNSASTNTYTTNINLIDYYHKMTLAYTADQNNSILNMNQQDYLNFINNTIPYTPISTTQYTLSIPAATATGGRGNYIGTAGTANNTCNGGGGGANVPTSSTTGGTGCIFGQYSGANSSSHRNGYGYGDIASNKYRCALIFIVNGNLIINSTITQTGGDSNGGNGGYGGGAYGSTNGGGGGGAPVFIYYTSTYVNNGMINTAGGNGGVGYYNYGGAGGIKTTKITL